MSLGKLLDDLTAVNVEYHDGNITIEERNTKELALVNETRAELGFEPLTQEQLDELTKIVASRLLGV